jgi:hypothetical protein
MVSIPKIVGVMSCSFMLCLGLSNVVQAEHSPSPSDNMKSDATSDRQEFQSDDDRQRNVELKSSRAEGERTISGELFLVESGHYFVKEKDGKEIRLHTDKTTEIIGEVMKNDYVEAKVNDQNHALSIRSVDKPF